jgi:hypothetical protein
MTDNSDRELAEALMVRIEEADGVVIENGVRMVDRNIMCTVLRNFADVACAEIRDATTAAVANDPETAAALSHELDALARRIEARELVPSLQ